MINQYIQQLGLPGCGKSTYISEHYKTCDIICKWFNWNKYTTIHDDDYNDIYDFITYAHLNHNDSAYIIISADSIKEYITGYDPDNVTPEIHEDSVQQAREYLFKLAEDPNHYYNVILDGGGINGHYNMSIMEKIRETNPNAHITTLFYDTPVEVCIERIKNRKRKVPIAEIYKKNQKLIKCINRYYEVSDEFIRIDYFTNKYILLDMDGTIAAYGKSKIDEDGNTDFVNCERFLHCQPVPHMIEFIKQHYNMNNVYIVTACANSIAWNEKLKWIDEYFPEIPNENRMFVGNKHYKHVFIKHLAIKKKWCLKDICLIDDFHDTIQKCTALGINAIHPSNIDVMFNQRTYQA